MPSCRNGILAKTEIRSTFPIVIMLEGEKVRLVVLEKHHLPDIVSHWNDPEMRVFLDSYIPNSVTHEEQWMESVQERMKRRKEFSFAVEHIETGEFLGTVSLHDIDWISRSSTLGIVIHQKKNWNKGYGREGLSLIIDYAWTHLNLERIELSVYDFNHRAMHVYETVGFKTYGTAHHKHYIKGEYVDTHYMELLRQ